MDTTAARRSILARIRAAQGRGATPAAHEREAAADYLARHPQGPRPPLPEEVDAYQDQVFRRLHVRPGLTGLWQVSGRSDLSWEESVRLDLRYVDNWSVSMDLLILWKTARVVLGAHGAY